MGLEEDFMRASDLRGIFVPMLTPLTRKDGKFRLDNNSLIKEVNHVVAGSVQGVFFGANASEALFLPFDLLKESIAVGVNAVRNYNQGSGADIKIVVGLLRSNFNERLKLVKLAQTLPVNALVVVPNLIGSGVEPEENLQKIIAATTLPIIFYDNPKLTENKAIDPNWVKVMLERFPGRIIGIKESADDNVRLTLQYLEMSLANFSVMQGDTKGGLTAITAGANGLVPVEACANPKMFVDFYHNPNSDNFAAIENGIAARKQAMVQTGENWLQYFKRQMVEMGIFLNALTIGK